MATKIELSARRRHTTGTGTQLHLGSEMHNPQIKKKKKRNIIYVCNKSVLVTEMSQWSCQMPRDQEGMNVKTNEHPVRRCCVTAGARPVALRGLRNLRGRGRGHRDYRRSELYSSFTLVALCEMTEQGKIHIIKTKNVIISLIVSKQQCGFAAKSSRPA